MRPPLLMLAAADAEIHLEFGHASIRRGRRTICFWLALSASAWNTCDGGDGIGALDDEGGVGDGTLGHDFLLPVICLGILCDSVVARLEAFRRSSSGAPARGRASGAHSGARPGSRCRRTPPSQAATAPVMSATEKFVAGEKGAAVVELAVEPRPLAGDGLALGLGECRELDQPVLEELGRMERDVADRAEDLDLDAAVPHLDLAGAHGVRPEQRRARVQLLEIAADRDALGDRPYRRRARAPGSGQAN